jgi:predicted RNase H-like nuclease (RuvC/YqgF family)
VRTAILPQDVSDDLPGTVYDVVASGGEAHADLPRRVPRSDPSDQPKQKLFFKETRELETLPQTIEGLEGEKERLTATLNSPEFYASRDLAKLKEATDRLRVLEKELDEAYRRWDELESLAARLRDESGRLDVSDKRSPN